MSNEANYHYFHNARKRLRCLREDLEDINKRIDSKVATSKDFDERDRLKEIIKEIKDDLAPFI